MNDLIERQLAIDIERNATVDTNPSHFEAHQKFTQFMDDAEVSSFGRWQWSNGFNTALTAVGIDLKKLPSVQPEPKWIPCSERLPERADNVIICYKAGDYTLVSTGIYLYKFKMWYVDVVGDLRDGVTAWMSLPEPYRGGDSE